MFSRRQFPNSTYERLGLAEIARFEGSVQGVVVQAQIAFFLKDLNTDGGERDPELLISLDRFKIERGVEIPPE